MAEILTNTDIKYTNALNMLFKLRANNPKNECLNDIYIKYQSSKILTDGQIQIIKNVNEWNSEKWNECEIEYYNPTQTDYLKGNILLHTRRINYDDKSELITDTDIKYTNISKMLFKIRNYDRDNAYLIDIERQFKSSKILTDKQIEYIKDYYKWFKHKKTNYTAENNKNIYITADQIRLNELSFIYKCLGECKN